MEHLKEAGNMADRLRRLDLSQIRSQRVHRLHGYWRSKIGAQGSVPRRSDIDPTELPDLLPNLMLLDVERDPLRFRYRLVGTRVVDFSYHDFTGTYLDEAGWVEVKGFTRAYVDAVTDRKPTSGFYLWELRSGAPGTCEFALFPLSDEQGEISHVLAIEDYDFPLIDIDPDKMY
jgi:hypothetical protein